MHLVGYSVPTDESFPFEDLRSRIHTLPNTPDWIPYVTSYYAPNWGFCLSENELASMPDGKYRAFIDSELFDGALNYADLVIPGESEEELLFSTYICHPSMANNEVSGIVMNLALAEICSRACQAPPIYLSFRICS